MRRFAVRALECRRLGFAIVESSLASEAAPQNALPTAGSASPAKPFLQPRYAGAGRLRRAAKRLTDVAVPPVRDVPCVTAAAVRLVALVDYRFNQLFSTASLGSAHVSTH